jgi:ribose transport system substrate-binding protein
MKSKKVANLLTAAAVLIFFMAAGVAGYAGKTEEKPAETKVKMGMSFLNTSIPIANDAITMVKAAAKALDVELIVLDDEFNPDKQVANIENLVASGCDAVMICNSSEAVVPKMIKICDDAKVGLGLFFRRINDPEIQKMAQDSKYFIGVTHEDELNNGYRLGKALYKNGARNAAIINFNRGDATAEERYAGYVKAFKEDGVNILAEQWEIITGDKAAAATESFIAAYPELDCIPVIGGGGENLAGTISTIKNYGKTGDILVSSTDFIPNQYEMLKNGEISAISGGHWVDPFFEFMLLYNWASGHPLTDETAEVIVNFIFVSSPELQMEYDKWIKGDVPPYTDEEIRNLAVKYNPSMTFQKLLDTAYSYSIDDVKKRHKDLIK